MKAITNNITTITIDKANVVRSGYAVHGGASDGGQLYIS